MAQELGAEILSADSRQVYRFMDIGTAKPSPADLSLVRHYFIDELDPDEEFSAGSFGKAGRALIADILRRKKIPLVVGGSGLYIRSLVDGLFDGPSAEKDLRARLEERLEREGPEALLGELRAVDPAAAAKMLPTNTRRIIRALEVYHLTGRPISQMQEEDASSTGFMPVLAGLLWPRASLYERIDRRAEHMVEEGLIGEARRLLDMGYTAELNALQTVGYKEVFEFLDGKYDRERMIGLIKQNTRRYAKRQMTWFRQDRRIRWFAVAVEKDFPRVAAEICAYFHSGGELGK